LPATVLIAAGIVIAVAGSRIYGALARRRASSDAGRRRDPSGLGVPQSAEGVQAYAAAQDWTGPGGDLGDEQLAADYARHMLRNILAAGQEAGEAAFRDVYRGHVSGHAFLLGNASIGGRSGSVCVLHLGEVLPPLFVNLRAHQPYIRFAMKEITLESDAFNRRFQVLALDRKYATDVVSERTMALLLVRDDWVFALEFDRLVCVCGTPLATADDYRIRLDAVSQFASLIPPFVGQDRAAHMPTLPDGSTFDLLDPASREKFKSALLAMSPDQRAQFLAQVQESGARFLAGMFGKELPPEVLERIAHHLGQGPGGGLPPA
jgi:hypothetical protein